MTQDAISLAGRQDREQATSRAADARLEIERDDHRRLMETAWGRRIVWGLLADAGVFRSSFTGDNATFFNEGARNIGLQILARVTLHCPDKYQIMMMENRTDG